MRPIFEATNDGLEIIDRIERHRYRLTTHQPISIEPVEDDQIKYPVNASVRISTDLITLPTHNHIYIFSEDGSLIVEVQPDQQVSLPKGKYLLDLSGPLKVYAHVESSIQVYSDPQRTHINLGELTSVIIGARSNHMRPAETITTTADPKDVMSAISLFGSALKTTTPERSYPTLRGHPPAIELGNELAVPNGLKQPKNGVRLKVPPTLRHIFAIAPLAYYLGAKVVPSSEPSLITDTGHTHQFSRGDEFETAINRMLRQIFFLDCVIRTEGTTPLPLYKLEEIESLLGFDIESIYEQSLAKQIGIYSRVPFSEIKPYLPKWRLEVQLEATKELVEFLPFISNNLATINIEKQEIQRSSSSSNRVQAISEFTRNNVARSTDSVYEGEELSSASTEFPAFPTVQQRWSNYNGTNITSITSLSAFQNSVGRTPREEPIEIEVICNDPNMREELKSVNGAYGDREKLPFETTVYHNTTTNELEDIFEVESDFLHYIGHIDEEGFQCSDGKLDGSTVETVNKKAFLLNACQSRNQGLHLIEAGSIGGIVTLDEVINSGAVKIGNIVARLLNQGFPLYGALDIARNQSLVGQQYVLVGDGMTTIAQSETEVPNICVIRDNEGKISIQMKMYNSVQAKRGSIFTPHLSPVHSYYLVPGKTEHISVTKNQLETFLSQGRFPVLVDGTLHWSDEITVDSLQ